MKDSEILSTEEQLGQYLKHGGYKQAWKDFRALGVSDVVDKGAFTLVLILRMMAVY